MPHFLCSKIIKRLFILEFEKIFNAINVIKLSLNLHFLVTLFADTACTLVSNPLLTNAIKSEINKCRFEHVLENFE